jgi:hypothetical protein
LKVTEQTLQPKNEAQPEEGKGLKPWQWHVGALLFFGLLTLWMLGPLVTRLDHSLEQWGDALLQTWTLDWDSYAFRHDPAHLFNANAFYPYNNSLAFSESLVGQALLVAPLIWLTDNPVLGFNLLLLGSFILSGWGVYLLTYELTRRPVAGVVAGVIFAFFPNRFEQLSHLHLLATQWIPFCLLFLRRFLQNWKWLNGILFGLFLVLELLSSTYLGLFLVVAVGLYLLYRAAPVLLARFRKGTANFTGTFSSSGLPVWQKGLRLVIILLVAVVVVVPFFWPYLEVQRDLGFERSPAEIINWSAQPFYYLDIPKENKLNQWLFKPLLKQDWWIGGGGERALYLGLLALVLSAAGILVAWKWRKRERDTLFYLLLALVAFSFTFGPTWQTGRFGNLPLPYALLYNYIPGFQGLRVPVRFIYVVALGVAVLAGFAVAALQERLRLITWPRALALGGILCALLCLEYVSDVTVNDSQILRGDPPPAAKWLAVHPGPVLNVPLSGSDNSNLFYQYWTRGSWSPIMNGFSGFMPPAYDSLKAAVASEGFSPRIIELLQGLDVRYLVVDSEDDSVKPNWDKFKGQFKEAGLFEAAHFGGTYIYELKLDSWIKAMVEDGVTPDSLLYFVEYRRNDPQLLELVVYYLQQSGLSKRENLYGEIKIGFRQLPTLPIRRPADFLLIEAGEDPALYGFRPGDKLWGNSLLDLYRRNPALVSRLNFDRNAAPLGKGAFKLQGSTLDFSGPSNPRPGSPKPQYLQLTFAAFNPQPIQLSDGQKETRLELEPGVSSLQIPAGEDSIITFDIGQARILNAEVWQGQPPAPGRAILRQDIVLLQAETRRDSSDGVAKIKVVPKGGPGGYTATLDVYNYPWGTHPQGHYGYWSVPLNGEAEASLEYRLDLVKKQMVTALNNSSTANYPPDPQQFDISKYGRYGDFRASFNLYAGDTLAGSVRLFDFTIYTQGDKNRIDNRHIGAFTGYNTGIVLMVLPPNKK